MSSAEMPRNTGGKFPVSFRLVNIYIDQSILKHFYNFKGGNYV